MQSNESGRTAHVQKSFDGHKWFYRGPKGMEKFVGLQAKRCVPCEGKDITAMDESEAIKLRNQVCMGIHIHALCMPCTIALNAGQ